MRDEALSGVCGNQNRNLTRLKWHMKVTILLLVLVSPIIAKAQAPQPMTQKRCEQQGKIYVAEKNKEEPAPEPSRSFSWSFAASDYDSQAKTCYVMYNRHFHGFGTTLEQIKVDDIEGNHVAGFSAIWTSDLSGNPTYAKPSECNVNGANCESRAEFDALLGHLVPSFRRNTRPARGPTPA